MCYLFHPCHGNETWQESLNEDEGKEGNERHKVGYKWQWYDQKGSYWETKMSETHSVSEWVKAREYLQKLSEKIMKVRPSGERRLKTVPRTKIATLQQSSCFISLNQILSTQILERKETRSKTRSNSIQTQVNTHTLSTFESFKGNGAYFAHTQLQVTHTLSQST